MQFSHQLSLFKPQGKITITPQYTSDADVVLYHGDRLNLLKQIKAARDTARLIVTSPPYNVGKEYEEALPLDQYVEQQQATIEACVDVLADDGSICWQVGHYIEGSGTSKEAFPLDLVLYPIFKSFGLILKNRLVWTFGHGLHERLRFSGRHETVLWFVKSENYVFNLDPVRIPQKYPGKRSYRGPNKGKPSGNKDGKNPSDVWEMPNVKANHREKTAHPCQFPVGLVERLILSLTNEGDLVVDPYIGSGTTAASAVMHSRRIAGADIEADYLQIAQQRVQQAFAGTLPYRPMNKPVYEPGEDSKLASVPQEWLEDDSD